MREKDADNSSAGIGITNQAAMDSLALQWAKKYLHNLGGASHQDGVDYTQNLKDVVSQSGREETAKKLMSELRTASLQAWNKVEALLSQEINRHQIDPQYIDPWQISGDAYHIYEKTLEVYTKQAPLRQLNTVLRIAKVGEQLHQKAMDIYTQQVAPAQLATVIGANVGALRRKYTQKDPRVIGFVSMQFHFTSQILLKKLSSLERSVISAYLKAIDDHLYMPLQRAYEAAANHELGSPTLAAVQNLLPQSTAIAKQITQKVIDIYPNYRSYSGLLSNPDVRISSIRDVEMFQVYLWVSALEQKFDTVQQELFPLCVMLYPTLNVQWELIRQMLYFLDKEMNQYLSTDQKKAIAPYYKYLWELFSPEVFGEFYLQVNPGRFQDSVNTNSLFF